MDQERGLDTALRALGSSTTGGLPGGFMDGVWERACQMNEAIDGRRRLALFALVFATGLGAGFVTVQETPRAEAHGHQLIDGDDLSPAALLHIES